MPIVWLMVLLHPGPARGHPVQEVVGSESTYEACEAGLFRLPYPRRPGWHAHCYQQPPATVDAAPARSIPGARTRR